MILNINDFKTQKELIKLCNLIYKWLDGGDEYKKLQNDKLFKSLIIKYTNLFNYKGVIYRATRDEMNNNSILLSYSSNINSLCSLLDLFQYGGMITNFNNLPIYIDNIDNGFSVNKFIKYCNDLNIFNDDYLHYMDYDEIITSYNKPKIKYIFNFLENDNVCKFGHQAMKLHDVDNKKEINICSNNYL